VGRDITAVSLCSVFCVQQLSVGISRPITVMMNISSSTG